MSEREFDVVVVGAGPAGEVAAGRLGDAGLDVAVVEPEHAPAADTATGADDVPAAAADETTQEGAGHDDR